MDKEILLLVIQVISPAILGFIAYLARHYTKSIHVEINKLRRDVEKVEDRLTYILTELTKVSTELKWRFADKRPRPDMINGENL